MACTINTPIPAPIPDPPMRTANDGPEPEGVTFTIQGQAPQFYLPMDNPGTEQREPLLSDAEISAMDDRQSSNYAAGEGPTYTSGIEDGRDFYEAKITSGELMVVKTVKPQWNFENDPEGKWGTWECECFRRWDSNNTPDVGEFCNCGARIIE